MKKINVKDRVIVIEDNQIKKGTVKSAYNDLGMFIVEFDDGDTHKVPIERIALEPKAETTVESESQVKTEDAPRMKSEITITPDEFREIATEVLAEETVGHLTVGIAFMPILVKIHKALFYEDESGDSDDNE